MRELVRENGEFSSNAAGSKSYKEWKDAGHRLTKIVYILDANDINKLYKIQFSGLSFGEMNKILKDDAPNYLVTLKASSETKSTENGDFYMPTIVTEGDAPSALYDKIIERVTFVYNILNSTNESEGYETIPNDTEHDAAAEAAALFGADDIP